MSIDPGDVVDTETIGRRLGVTPQAVSQWKTRHSSFPARLPMPGVINPLYSWREVSRWALERRRNAAWR